MRKKLFANGIALLTSALLVSSLAGCTGLTPKIDVPNTEVPSDSEVIYVPVEPESEVKSEAESETEESASISKENNTEFSIIGSWYLRSYVNMTVIGYEIFDDGTWLAVENFGTLASSGSTHEEFLSGTWSEENSGGDFNEYSLYDGNGSFMKNAKVYVDEDGNSAMDFGQNVIFYKSNGDNSDNEPLQLLADSWLFPNGAEISFDDEGGWMLSDDEGQWLFGGHYVMEPAPNTVYLRLHSPFGDAGNRWVADGTLEYDADGSPMLNLSFMPELTDFTGRNMILYKKR